MEGDPGRVEAEPSGPHQQVDRVVDRAAVLARQRPVRARAGGDDAHEHRRPGCGVRDLGDLAGRVDDEEPHAEGVRLGEVVAAGDRVGVHQVGCRGTGGERRPHLRRAGDVEPASGLGERAQQHRVGVGLDRVVDRRAGQRGGEREVAGDGGADAQLERGGWAAAAASAGRRTARSRCRDGVTAGRTRGVECPRGRGRGAAHGQRHGSSCSGGAGGKERLGSRQIRRRPVSTVATAGPGVRSRGASVSGDRPA